MIDTAKLTDEWLRYLLTRPDNWLEDKPIKRQHKDASSLEIDFKQSKQTVFNIKNIARKLLKVK